MDRRVAGVVDDAEFDDLAFEKPQRPASAAFRGLRARQGDESGFPHPIEDLLDRRRRALFTAQGRVEALFDQLLACSMNRRLIGVQRLDDLRVAPARPGRGNVRQKQDASFRRHCQSKIYTACSRIKADWSSTVFAHELTTRSAGFDAENRLYLFALTMPSRGRGGRAEACHRT